MNSYTISGLSPARVYTVVLCLDKSSHKLPISKLELRTRPQSYMVQLGIVKDYTAIIAGMLIQIISKNIITRTKNICENFVNLGLVANKQTR